MNQSVPYGRVKGYLAGFCAVAVVVADYKYVTGEVAGALFAISVKEIMMQAVSNVLGSAGVWLISVLERRF